jgi:hypothetical protein
MSYEEDRVVTSDPEVVERRPVEPVVPEQTVVERRPAMRRVISDDPVGNAYAASQLIQTIVWSVVVLVLLVVLLLVLHAYLHLF